MTKIRCSDPAIYDTTIACALPMPRHILDSKGKLFQKNKTIFEPGQDSRVAYSEVEVTVLSSVEAAPALSIDAKYSVD